MDMSDDPPRPDEDGGSDEKYTIRMQLWVTVWAGDKEDAAYQGKHIGKHLLAYFRRQPRIAYVDEVCSADYEVADVDDAGPVGDFSEGLGAERVKELIRQATAGLERDADVAIAAAFKPAPRAPSAPADDGGSK